MEVIILLCIVMFGAGQFIGKSWGYNVGWNSYLRYLNNKKSNGTNTQKRRLALNPNDKVVNGVLKMIENNNGECPCHNEMKTNIVHSDYREKNECHCNLYVKIG